ncbi:MAG: ferritin family protein [Chloroflexi bacterium]|nr:ferritin family protein [Chloroflexota bacterium]MBI2980468.1 ferritin family protein [Chloroflexota bacterium]
MLDELAELLDTAIYKEIAANAFYSAGQAKTQDPGARMLMRELAEEELKHSQWLKDFKEKGVPRPSWQPEKIADLMISEYLTGGDTLEGAGLQDTLTFAIKRELQAIDFYSRMMGVIRDEPARRVCQRLVREETRHKLRLEKLYDDMFYKEN